MNCAGLVKYENHTHVKKMGHTLEFLFGIYWWTWKTTIKKMLKWTNKKCKNFNIYSVARKTPGYIIILHLCTKILDMIYSSWYRVWPTETGNYGSLFALLHPILKTQKIKRKKTIAGDIIILHKCTKNHTHMRYASWDTMRQTNNFVI